MKKINKYCIDYVAQDHKRSQTLEEVMETIREERGSNKYAYMGQTHSDHIALYDGSTFYDDTDALISTEPDVLLLAQYADCVPIYVYDQSQPHYAMIHSGWKGTKKEILPKVIKRLIELGSEPENLFVIIGPCISWANYEVGEEFKTYFNSSYIIEEENRLYLDLRKVVFYQALEWVSEDHIEVDSRCTFNDHNLHSYRRDGLKAKRNVGSIIYET